MEGSWEEYFEELLNAEEEREADIIAVAGEEREGNLGDLNDLPICMAEVETAVKELKAGKAPGADGVVGECLKNGGRSMTEWLVRLFNICFVLGTVPEDWVSACIVPL